MAVRSSAGGVLRKPILVRFRIGLLVFLGVTALGGGMVMAFGLGGDQVTPPQEWLEDTPIITSWVVPGLVLGVGFGLGSLVTSDRVARRPRWRWLAAGEKRARHHRSWLATILTGSGLVVWIVLELVFLPWVSWSQPLYGTLGLAILILQLTLIVSDYLHLR